MGRGFTAAMLALALPLLALPAAALAAGLPGAPPVSRSSFVFEPAGQAPVDNDGKIPSPSTPVQPTCTGATIVAPSNGSAAAIQRRIDADVAAGTAFSGDTICLSGTFRGPIHIWGKVSSKLLTIAPAPGQTATFNLAGVTPTLADADPNDHDGNDVPVVGIDDSRDVEIYGLTIENWVSANPGLVPAGIYVTVTRTDASSGVTASACYAHSADGVCGDIFLLNNTVENVATTAPGCGNLGNGTYSDAYGIGVQSYGGTAAQALQHLVLEGNTVERTKTGQSETVTINGDVRDFLVAHNTIENVNNIGLDMIGWETGGATLTGGHSVSQARDGYVFANTVQNVDTRLNPGYGRVTKTGCQPGDMSAGGIYADGAWHVWIDRNTVTNTNHGIELGAEDQDGRAGESADALLVTSNVVSDTAGDTFGDPAHPYDDAGHAFDAFVVGGVPDASGTSEVRNVLATGNTFTNASQFFVDPSSATMPAPAPVVLFEGGWGRVWLLGNTFHGGGSGDALNALLELDSSPGLAPTAAPGVVMDCNTYGALASTSDNFLAPGGAGWVGFASYASGNRFATSELGVSPARWDSDSSATTPASCPFAIPR